MSRSIFETQNSTIAIYATIALLYQFSVLQPTQIGDHRKKRKGRCEKRRKEVKNRKTRA